MHSRGTFVAVSAVCFVLLLVVLGVNGTPKAAIYVDNGLGQTAVDRMLSIDEKHEMELEILNLLGLPNRPRKINKEIVRRSAPRFLLDIYKSLSEDEHDDLQGTRRIRRNTASDINLSGEEQHQIDESDVIMTFESVENHVDSVRHERGKRLWFNVSEIPVAEDIVGAELKIFQNESLSNRHHESNYTVTVYQLIHTDDGERELEFISAVNTTAGFQGWLGLNVTDALGVWAALPETNKGLYLSVHPVEKPAHEIRPEDIGLMTLKTEDETQPFMVAFMKATNHVKARKRREAKSRVKKSDVHTFFNNKNEQVELARACQIHTLYINFKDLQWQDWIIAPDGYAAYYCSGECNFPLNAHMNASNHAIVQTLVHLMQPLRYPKPCCAPTTLGSISVLYFLDDKNVILKKYKKMVVKTCGCR